MNHKEWGAVVRFHTPGIWGEGMVARFTARDEHHAHVQLRREVSRRVQQLRVAIGQRARGATPRYSVVAIVPVFHPAESATTATTTGVLSATEELDSARPFPHRRASPSASVALRPHAPDFGHALD